MKIRREWIGNFIQYLVGCILITVVIRWTACKYLEETTDKRRTDVGCKSKIDVERIFPEKKKLWIQIGTYFNPISPPSDVGMIAFEAELRTVAKVAESRKENIFFIPAAVSDHAGVAVFGGGINAGQSSSLNVGALECTLLHAFIVFLHNGLYFPSPRDDIVQCALDDNFSLGSQLKAARATSGKLGSHAHAGPRGVPRRVHPMPDQWPDQGDRLPHVRRAGQRPHHHEGSRGCAAVRQQGRPSAALAMRRCCARNLHSLPTRRARHSPRLACPAPAEHPLRHRQRCCCIA